MTLANKVMLNASALALGRFASAGMGIIAVGVTTRYLGVGGYGALATALAFTAIINTLTDLGIGQIGTRELAKRPDEGQRILGALMTAAFGLSILAAVLGVAATLVIYGGDADAMVRRGVLLLMITIPLAAPNAAIGALFIARQQAYFGAFASVIGSVVTLAGIVIVVGLDWGFTTLILVYVVAAVIQIGVMARFASGLMRLLPSWDPALSRQLIRWALPLGGALLVYTLYWRMDIVLLSVLSTDEEVGLYGLAYRVVDVLVTLPTFIAITLLPEYARLSEERERFRDIMEKAQALMIVGALGLAAFFLAFGSEVADVLGGPEFDAAGTVLRILAIGAGLNFLSASFGQGFVALNQQKRLLWLSLALLPLNIGLNLALIPGSGADGAAIAFALTEVLQLLMIVLLYRGFAAVPRPRRLLQVALAAAGMALVAAWKLLPFAEDLDSGVILGIGGALSLATYVGALYALKAMPIEVHTNLILPLWSRLRP